MEMLVIATSVGAAPRAGDDMITLGNHNLETKGVSWG